MSTVGCGLALALGFDHDSSMNFPPFWAKGSSDGFSCWRWSTVSLQEAQAVAQEAARKLAGRFAGRNKPLDRYAYGDRPLRELVLREFRSNSGDLAAVITRNSYGCLVLNTARAMFVDVDLPEPDSAGGGFLKKLFGKSQPAPANNAQDLALAKAEVWVQQHPEWGWRVYRTRAGLRLLATHALFNPESAPSETAFDALGADPLYRRLCKNQKCFRARLTPKPWRCGVWQHAPRWPWPDAKAESRFQKWEKKYLAACGEFATLGNRQVHADVQSLVNVHDEATRAETKLKLA